MKFYYLRDFRKENGFNRIDLCERMILSALLTSKINGDDRDLVEIIMNYDGSQNYTAYTNWQNYKDFATIITKFLKNEKGYISDFISKHYNDIDEDGNRKFYYVGFDYDDLNIHHKNSMMSIACRAFILSCANHSVHDNNDWFEFNICQWSKIAMNQRKRTIEEIDNFMNMHNISYEIFGNKIKIGNKRKQSQAKKAKDKKETYDNVSEQLNKEEVKLDPVENIIPAKEPDDIIEDNLDNDFLLETDIDELLMLSDERNFSADIMNKIYEYNNTQDINYIQNKYNEYKKYFISKSKSTELILNKVLEHYKNLNVNELLKKYKNLDNFINKKFSSEKYGETKDAAREELKNIKAKISKDLSNLYDHASDVNVYLLTVFYVLQFFKSTLSLNF